jgi:N-acyl-D-aspartate/D-glutamate deacylase
MHDLIFRGATLYDGSGGPPRVADLAVSGGVISAIDVPGVIPDDGARVIDGAGCWLTPGFVDVHTHYDGQVSWDPELAPSALNGVTTVVTGSCGVGFAPCAPHQRAALIALMEGVEDIPGSALAEGIQWGWQSFPEYLDAIAATPRTIDVLCMVPHDALRVFVMGERALRAEPATPADLHAMRALLREALGAGAAGFSTGRTDNHRSASGACTPAHDVQAEELVALAKAFDGLGHGVLQAVSDFDLLRDPSAFDAEFDVLEAMFAAAPGHRASLSWIQREPGAGQVRQIQARVEAATARGLQLRLQTAPRGIGVLLGLEATFHPFIGHPTYRAMHGLPLAERVAKLRDPAVKAQILSEAPGRVSGDGTAIPPLADLMLARIEQIAFRLFVMAEQPDYEPPLAASLGARARALGAPALSVIYDALLEDEGRALLYFPIFNYAPGDLSDVAQMMQHPAALFGLGDAGAHVGTICDYAFPTFALDWWGRRRPTGRMPIERLVELLSGRNAEHMGLHDRGRLAVGLRADLNLIDPEALRLSRPVLVADLPAGGRRLHQAASGLRCTVKNGEIIAQDGVLTGARPGGLVRLGA